MRSAKGMISSMPHWNYKKNNYLGLAHKGCSLRQPNLPFKLSTKLGYHYLKIVHMMLICIIEGILEFPLGKPVCDSLRDFLMKIL